MNMGVKHGLTCGFATIHTDIEPNDGRVFFKESVFQPFYQFMGIASFLAGHFKIIHAVPPGDDEQVVPAHRRTVLYGKHGVIFNDNGQSMAAAKPAMGKKAVRFFNGGHNGVIGFQMICRCQRWSLLYIPLFCTG